MKHRRGNMWDVWDEVDLFLITTNGSTTKDNRLVMGRGIARQARDRFPRLDYNLGMTVLNVVGWRYGLMVSDGWPGEKLGCFQVKGNWWEPADPNLIQLSAAMLGNWCGKHPEAVVALNFPGIGNGGLAVEIVLPLIEGLPDAVQVWRY